MKSIFVILAAGLSLQAIAERTLPVDAVAVVPASQVTTQQSLLGQVEALESATLGFELPGRVDRLAVREGDTVSAGQVLAFLDTDLIDQQVAQAQASVAQIQTQLKLSRSTLKRLENARAEGAITDQRIDEARQQLEGTVANLAAAQAQLATLTVQRDKHQLRAPFAGQVTARHLSPGAVITAGSPVFDLVTSDIRVRIAVPDGVELALGQTIEIRKGSESAMGQVYAWLNTRDAITAARQAWVSLSSDVNWIAGDWVQAQVSQQQTAQGFWVPVSALARDAAGWILYRIDDESQAQPLAVQVIETDAQQALVRGDLQPGDALVADGLHRMVPGQRVELNKVVAQ